MGASDSEDRPSHTTRTNLTGAERQGVIKNELARGDLRTRLRMQVGSPRAVPEEGLDVSLILAGAQFPSDLLLHLAETVGNPLELLVSKAHLSKAFCRAARDAQGLLKHAKLRKWKETVDDAVLAALVSKCTQLTRLDLAWCNRITDDAVLAVASGCTQLSSLNLLGCSKITDTAVVALTSGCTQLASLNLHSCDKITDAAVVALASACPQLTHLDLCWCCKLTDVAVLAVASRCAQLSSLNLLRCDKITDAAVEAVASGCPRLTFLNLAGCEIITDVAVLALASGCKQLASLGLYGCESITDAAMLAVRKECKKLKSICFSTVAEKRAARQLARDRKLIRRIMHAPAVLVDVAELDAQYNV